MDFLKFMILQVFIITSSFNWNHITLAAKDKYTDENRPYEFGFNIEGEQHRREKKDENGLIMGEFGFITADGVYHVTVYATDKEGRFKILSMKNIKLGPAPETTPKPLLILTSTLPPPPGPLRPLDQQYSPSSPRPAGITTAKPLPIASCSHCSIPSTTQRPSPSSGFVPNTNLQAPFQNPPSSQIQGQQYPQGQGQQPAQGQQYPQGQGQQPAQGQQYPQGQGQQYPQGQGQQNAQGQGPQNPQGQRYPDQQSQQNTQFPITPDGQPAVIQQRPGGSRPMDPIVISAAISPADPSSLTKPLGPGERPGAPPGITDGDMLTLLYKFNYTVGFHGHHEEGYVNGFKKGEYYINNRNGIATKVTYTADDKGYHPKIETVRLSDIETPKEETEKNPEFGLKGYEFQWFYVPKYHYLNQKYNKK